MLKLVDKAIKRRRSAGITPSAVNILSMIFSTDRSFLHSEQTFASSAHTGPGEPTKDWANIPLFQASRYKNSSSSPIPARLALLNFPEGTLFNRAGLRESNRGHPVSDAHFQKIA